MKQKITQRKASSKRLCVFLMLAMLLTLLPACSSQEGKSVYAKPSLQKKICKVLAENEEFQTTLAEPYGLRCLEASVTPVYTVDRWAVIDTDEISVFPLEGENGRRYAVKLLDENDDYAGNLIFDYDGETVSNFFWPPQPFQEKLDQTFLVRASLSYADQAERIRMLAGKTSVFSPESVRLLYVADMGGFLFYIHTENDQFFVFPGVLSVEEIPGYTSPYELRYGTEVMYGDKFTELCKVGANWGESDYEWFYNEQFLKNPGVIWYGANYQARFFQDSVGDPIARNTENVIDIEGYFKR